MNPSCAKMNMIKKDPKFPVFYMLFWGTFLLKNMQKIPQLSSGTIAYWGTFWYIIYTKVPQGGSYDK